MGCALLALAAGCAAQPAPGGMALGLLGDTPYSEGEIRRLDLLIGDINAVPLAFVVHVGDIGNSRQACNDDWLSSRKIQFGRFRHPFVLLPGDNEWSDCKDPVERLKAWRKFFCEQSLQTERQPGEFCEHVRWEAGGLVFVALNVPGSNNNVGHPEHAPRMSAVFQWLDEAARLAESRAGLVVLVHANPFITLPRDGYFDLRNKLTKLGEAMPGRVILVHGDTHTWHDNEPLPGVRRLEVWGAPFVSWLEVPLEGGRLGASAPRHR